MTITDRMRGRTPARHRLLLLLVTVLALVFAGGAAAQAQDPADQPPEPADTRAGRGGGPRPDPTACERAAQQSRVHDVCASRSSGGAARADYDGDGHTDLAIGVPGRTVSGQPAAGLVYVVYGSADGLTSSRVQILWQGMSAAMGPLGRDHHFGGALAGGDFNGDGVADLAIGVPGHNGGQGAVKVVYGVRSQGLGAAVHTFALTSQKARFASALVWGDFNSDGRADLAIGGPYLDILGDHEVGAVWVLYGSPTGLTTSGAQIWWQEVLGPASAPVQQDRPGHGPWFGYALAAGDVGRSAHHDLVIGSPWQDGQHTFSGGVHVLYGGTGGLSTTGAQRWHFGLTGSTVPSYFYGGALAIGDFNGDSVGDLAIGAPNSKNAGWARGLVHVLGGTRDGGLSMSVGHRVYSALGPTPDWQSLGRSLAAADFNGDSRADLAIGAPGETVAGQQNAGAVYVIHGGGGGLAFSPAQRWHQGANGLYGTPVADNWFGSSLTAWNWGRGTQGDLAVGVPGQTVSGLAKAGVVQVLYGSSSGLSSSRQQYVHEGRLPGAGPAAGARFGSALY